ncbi:MAG: DUF882 domain-containing protein [Alphaproteobacteria bacterium]|nr:DUF882 domain-containing protein [Alphaproteobacteria bacterium]MBF0250692.1 DUF882 domain-containing protein [Alphaproteobacteria bacterium]
MASSEDHGHGRAGNAMSRRALLMGGLAMLGASAPVGTAWGGVRVPREKSLTLRNLHTGEKVKTVFWADGHFVPEGCSRIEWIFRDHRTDEKAEIDPALLVAMHDLQKTVGTTNAIQVVCGYRSPKTNAALRKISSGVAKKSYHIKGMAIDLRIKGVALRDLHRAAVSLKRGGVGYYPKSDFVHIDTGPVRYWS